MAAAILAATTAVTTLTSATSHAVVGTTAKEGSYPFTAKLDIGGERGCSAALVEQRWLVTAASCFADKSAPSGKVQPGAPKSRTTAVIGRADLTRETGTVVDVVELVPREDRDLVLAKLAWPITSISPIRLATNAPLAGEDVWVAGFGRTKDQWVPDQLHYAKFAVGTVEATSMVLSSKSEAAVVCQGDSGGPAFRDTAGRYELVGVNSRSWQGSCLGNDSENRTGAVDTRLDDITEWIKKRTAPQPVAPVGDYRIDVDGDGKADYLVVGDNGSVQAFLNKGGDGHGGWSDSGVIATGTGAPGVNVRFADVNGDGKADYLVVGDNGSVHAFLNKGGDGHGGWTDYGIIATGAGSPRNKVRFADVDGDGKADYLVVGDNGSVQA
ncbi:trypsin-like serine protease, partial [Streptomyces luteireticuli]|uniref:trypsin-like serine protease n=1 Tax=Streptomyces luteireticuli TaxID=173858 RepID=UPI0031DAE351